VLARARSGRQRENPAGAGLSRWAILGSNQ
jgi:hypothetical protein